MLQLQRWLLDVESEQKVQDEQSKWESNEANYQQALQEKNFDILPWILHERVVLRLSGPAVKIDLQQALRECHEGQGYAKVTHNLVILALLHRREGEVHRRQLRKDLAAESFQRSRLLFEQLLIAEPSNNRWKAELKELSDRIAEVSRV